MNKTKIWTCEIVTEVLNGILENKRNLLIIGWAGTGKSYFLQKIYPIILKEEKWDHIILGVNKENEFQFNYPGTPFSEMEILNAITKQKELINQIVDIINTKKQVEKSKNLFIFFEDLDKYVDSIKNNKEGQDIINKIKFILKEGPENNVYLIGTGQESPYFLNDIDLVETEVVLTKIEKKNEIEKLLDMKYHFIDNEKEEIIDKILDYFNSIDYGYVFLGTDKINIYQ